MKIKKSYIIFDILGILAFLGSYLCYYFTERKLGFVRWENHFYRNLCEAVPLATIKWAAFIIIAALAVIIAVRVFRKKVNAVNNKIMAAVMLCAAAYYLYATISIVFSYTTASFLMVPLIALGVVMFEIRSLIGLKAK